MPFEYPMEESRRSLDRMWEDVWRLVEQLRLMEERIAGDAGAKAEMDQRIRKLERNSGGKAVTPSVGQHKIPIGSIDAGSTATTMTATVPGITALENGVAAYIRNGVVTSASGWTLNVNGLGAKKVYSTMADASEISTTYSASYTMLFVYNESRVTGGCWDMYYGYYTNSNTLAYQVRTERTCRTLADRTSRYALLFSMRDGKIMPSYVKSSGNAGTETTKVLNTGRAWDPKLPILYYAATTNVPAGNQIGGSVTWRQYHAVDLRYTSNVGSTLTACLPVFIRCVPNPDGTVQLDGNDCFVQALPSAEDGKVYVWLGVAYGTTGYNIEMDPEHPVFEFKEGRLQRWT